MHQGTDKTKRRCYAKAVPYDQQKWFRQYKFLAKDYSHHVLLESGRGGQFSIIGLGPFAIMKGKNNYLSVESEGNVVTYEGNLLQNMRKWLEPYQTSYVPEYPEFQGGAIGYISYDYFRYIENISERATDDLQLPDLYFYMFDDVFIYDHIEKKLWLMTHDHVENEVQANERLSYYEKLWMKEPSRNESYSSKDSVAKQEIETAHNPDVSLSENDFINAVEKVQRYIANGDVFQVNLSVRQSQSLRTNAFHIYEKLREINPSPYMAYIQFPEFQVVSGSPELLIKKKGTEVSTRPIAGTRSRGVNDEEDLRLAQELISNEKERAEHVMLVDLERNDIGRVCSYGSVEVNEFMVIEKYSHVMHIVSNVRGELNPNNSSIDVIEAVFPGGTITGAPKVRTMEIIEELEPLRRGIYTGSIGWISFYDDMELNIAIRTMVVKDHVCYVQAGAGIVIDSNPRAEYNESLKKGKALWKAKELSEKEYNESRKEKVE